MKEAIDANRITKKICRKYKKIKKGSQLIQDIEQISKDYWNNYTSEENTYLRDAMIGYALNNPKVKEMLKKSKFNISELLRMDFYEVLHLFEGDDFMKKIHFEDMVDQLVVTAIACLQQKEFRDLAADDDLLLVENFSNLEELYIHSKYISMENKLASAKVASFELGSVPREVIQVHADDFTKLYGISPELEKKFYEDPKKRIVLEKFYTSLIEHQYEKANIEVQMKRLLEKFPSVSKDGLDIYIKRYFLEPYPGKEEFDWTDEQLIEKYGNGYSEYSSGIKAFYDPIILYRGGIKLQDGRFEARNRFETRDEAYHINTGSNRGVKTAFISASETPIVLATYIFSDNELDLETTPNIIDVRVLYQMLEERKEALKKPMCYDGEEEMLQLLKEEPELSHMIPQINARLQLIREKKIQKYERDYNLPEGFSDRDKNNSYAEASAEVLFKASIPKEALIELDLLTTDLLVSLTTRSNAKYRDDIIDSILKYQKDGKNFSNEIMAKIVSDDNPYGLNEIELDFIKRYYKDKESIENFIYIPDTETEGYEKNFIEKSLGYDAVNSKELDSIRKEQVEMGFRTAIVEKLLHNPQFLRDAGIEISEFEIKKLKIGNLIQPKIRKDDKGERVSEKRHARTKRKDIDGRIRTYVIAAENHEKLQNIPPEYREPIMGILATDKNVAIESRGISTKTNKLSIKKVISRGITYKGPDGGEIRYSVLKKGSKDFSYGGFREYVGPALEPYRLDYDRPAPTEHDWRINWEEAMLARERLGIFKFEVKYMAKQAAANLGGTITYFLDRNRQNREKTNDSDGAR